jgi:hypothetical protein
VDGQVVLMEVPLAASRAGTDALGRSFTRRALVPLSCLFTGFEVTDSGTSVLCHGNCRASLAVQLQ